MSRRSTALTDQVGVNFVGLKVSNDGWQIKTKRRHKDGTQVHVSLGVSPIRSANGEIIGVSKTAVISSLGDTIPSGSEPRRLASSSERTNWSISP